MITPAQLLAALIKVLVMVGFVFNVGGLLTWVDRRQSSMIQDRIGPNRANISIFGFEIRAIGLLHAAADGVKFFFKEDFVPPKADKLLFALAPILSMIPVLGLLGVIPMGDTLCLNKVTAVEAGKTVFLYASHTGMCQQFIAVKGGGVQMNAVDLAISPLNVGILYVFAMAGQGIVGAAIAGWSSDNKFSLMGALRAASQMVSYEVAIGLSLVGAMMVYGTVRLDDMVRWQGDNAWGIFVQPLAFILFFVASIAENKRIPFDLPEAESELVSGYFTEYSGMKFGMFYFAEYMEIVTGSMLLVTIFLGGWQLPFFHRDGITVELGTNVFYAKQIPHVGMIALNVVTFFGKTLLMCLFQAVIRWSLPRFRYDQLMKLGWLVLLPASLVNVMVTGVVILLLQEAGTKVDATLVLAGHLTQAVVALAGLYGVDRFFLWLGGSRDKDKTLVGSSAKFANAAGGTVEGAMQA